MKNFINIFIIFKIFVTLYSPVFSNEKREVIKAYEKGKPARLDIEVTKVKSDNFIQLEIDRKKRKIFKNITKFSDKDKDLDRKLYVTTYLKPTAKTNTVGDELSYKITASNTDKYLEIDYDKEPKNVYLWVVKNGKVEKLYTGVFNDVTPDENATIISSVYSKVLSQNNEFSFEVKKKSPSKPELSKNLYKFTGSFEGWKQVNKNYHVEIILSFTKQNDEKYTSSKNMRIPVHEDKGEAEFSLDELNFSYEIDSDEIEFDLEFKNFNFKEVTVDFIYHAGQGESSNIKGRDILTIFFPSFEISATDMDFGEFHKLEGATATSNITVANSTNLNFQLSIPKSINITHSENSEITIPVGLNLQNNIITGNISKPNGENNAYAEGSYRGLIPLEVILSPQTKGGKF